MKKHLIILPFVALISIVLLIFSVFRLLEGWEDYQKGTNTYEELNDSFVKQYGRKGEEEKEKEQSTEEISLPGTLEVDFVGLQEINPDIMGWIEVPGLSLSYPILQGTDNQYYLKHLADRSYGISGSIFVDYHNQPDFSGKNTLIYGHNMKDGSIFATLDQYAERELYEGEPYFYIYLPGKVLQYQIFSCYAGRVGSEAYYYEFPYLEDYASFLHQIQSYAEYDTRVEVRDTDRVVTLSTCTNTNRNYRYLVHGVLLREWMDYETKE